jgi:hypothetical protein
MIKIKLHYLNLSEIFIFFTLHQKMLKYLLKFIHLNICDKKSIS